MIAVGAKDGEADGRLEGGREGLPVGEEDGVRLEGDEEGVAVGDKDGYRFGCRLLQVGKPVAGQEGYTHALKTS